MKLVILDRDGVINYDSEHYIKTPDEWIPIPGSLAAIGELCRRGFSVVVASNQSGVGRGLYDEAMLLRIHEKMCAELAHYHGQFAGIFYCPHTPDDLCDCRKPAPGLLHQISHHFNQPLQGVPFIGDSYRDIEAAELVDCEPILVKTGNGDKTVLKYPDLAKRVRVFENLADAAQAIIDSSLRSDHKN